MDKKFPCGKQIPNKAGGKIKTGGILEGCLHYCPNPDISGDVNNCPDFLDFYEKLYENEVGNEK